MRFSKLSAAAAMVGAASADSICDKYTTALLMDNTAANQYSLVTLLVKSAALGNFTGPGTVNPMLPGSNISFPGFLAPATFMGEQVNLAQYFTGMLASTNVNGMPAAVNWLDTDTNLLVSDPLSLGEDGTNGQALLTHLVQYFGVLLGCSGYGTANFSTYQGVNNQYQVHQYMDLSAAEFNYFINQTGDSALSFGAATDDVMSVAMALNNTFGYRCAAAAAVVPDTDAAPQVICQGASCPLDDSPVAGCSGDAAVASYTPSSAATVTMSATIDLNTANPTGTAPTGTTGPLASNMPSVSNTDNAAPLQTAAAGFVAGAAAIAAAFL